MKVNVISESGVAPGQGVDSVFLDTVRQLQDYTDADVEANSSRRADIIHVHTAGPYALWQIARRRGAGVVISAHVTPDSFVGSLVGAKYWYFVAKGYFRWFYNLADAVLAVSEETEREVKKMGVRRPVYLVPNTIVTRDFESSEAEKKAVRRRLRIDEAAFVVLAVGQVQPRKRVVTFVEAAKQLPDLEFVWVGGMQFKALAADNADLKRVMQHPGRNVRFPGIVDRKTAMKYYQAADLFFLPSEQETFGLVIVEAAAAGLPVLLRDLAQYRETFAGGYEKGSEQTFAAQIEKFARDREYYRHWQRASKSIAERYSAEAGAQRLMEVYSQVLRAKHKINAAAS